MPRKKTKTEEKEPKTKRKIYDIKVPVRFTSDRQTFSLGEQVISPEYGLGAIEIEYPSQFEEGGVIGYGVRFEVEPDSVYDYYDLGIAKIRSATIEEVGGVANVA